MSKKSKGVKGMESVIATVSGYHGSDRFNLIKLISRSGASYVGSFSKSITHLVCWEFQGKKYELANKFNTVIVNHRWIEDCFKYGRRVPERPYTEQSGQEVGPLRLQVPQLNEKQQVVSDQSFSSDTEEEEEESDMSLDVWTDSVLLKENCLLEVGKDRNKQLKKTSKRRNGSRNAPLSDIVEVENEDPSSDSSTHCGRGKRKVPMHEGPKSHSKIPPTREKLISKAVCSTSSAKSVRKGRRLVKKSIGRDALETVVLDSDQDEEPNTGGCDDRLRNQRETADGRNDPLEVVDRNSPLCQERVAQNRCSDSENHCEKAEDTSQSEHGTCDSEHDNRLPSSEVSCAICWTEFSSTRGVLPCGHRFCFPCIQEWADHRNKLRKISTCPLCKASFASITMVEDAAASDQKIYSQTVPCALPNNYVYLLGDQDRPSTGAQELSSPACCQCRSQEPEDLLVRCHLCQIRCIHSYCLDPPVFPWTCLHCQELQMLYRPMYL